MKVSKIIFLLMLSFSLFSSSMAMESDSGDEKSYSEDLCSENEKSDNNAQKSFKFLKLPAELRYQILYLDLASAQGKKVRTRANILSLVCKLIKEHVEEFKKRDIWQKLLAVEEHVRVKKSDEIVSELGGAAIANDIERVKFLILGNADGTKNYWGDTALTCAASRGYKEIVRVLIAAGADLNPKDNNGNTALSCAVCKGDIEIVKMLMAAGADLNAKNNSGLTALNCAAYTGNIEILELIKSAELKSKAEWFIFKLENEI